MRLLRCGEAIPQNTTPHNPPRPPLLLHTNLQHMHAHADPDVHCQSHPDFNWLRQPDGGEEMNNIPEL